jgi:DNA-damage-inducible protein J
MTDMTANAFVRARIADDVKNRAAAVLAEMGLTVSDLMRIVLTRVAREGALPFDMKVPNAETRAAMEEARAMGRARFATAEALIDDLEKAGGE